MAAPFRIALMLTAAMGSAFTHSPQAEAHGVESSLRYLDGQLELTSSFSTGEPVEGAVVRLLQADGTPGEELGRIDAEGRLQMTLPQLSDGLVDLQVDGGPGHRDYLEMRVNDGEVNPEAVVSLPVGLGLIGLLVSVRRRIDEDIDDHQHRQ